MSFGKYELLASLGQGGMADVFLAASGSAFNVKKFAVLKRPRSGVDDDATIRQMFLDEARLAARLNHPNVVQTYEVGEHAGVPFLAMEFLEGQPLSRLLREITHLPANVPVPMLMRIASDALFGLHYAHELADYDGSPLQIVHRDVSPQNVFVTYDGQVKIVDFGVAKAAGNVSQTESGALKGKVSYMAPEQVREAPIDRRADVYAMGVVCWEVIAQRRLFTGSSSAAVLDKVASGHVPRLAKTVAGVAPLLDAIVHRALHRDPEERFQTAQEMRDALESYIAASGTVVLPDAIALTMMSLFSDVRAEVTAKVKAYMAAESTPELPDPRTATLTLGTLDLQGSALAPLEANKPPEASAGSLAASVRPVHPKAKRGARARQRRWTTAIVVSSALVIGLAAGLHARANHEENRVVRAALDVAARPRREPAAHLETLRAPTAALAAPLRDRPSSAVPASSPKAPPASPAPTDPARPRRPIDTSFPSE